MTYLEFEVPARTWSTEQREILMAKMSQYGFMGFIEGENLIQAYIEERDYSGPAINEMVDDLSDLGIRIQYRFHKKEEQNWNEEWEKKFRPVAIGDNVLVRAPFHDPGADRQYTLLIEPKMSFGTGHHHTTRMMILGMNKVPVEGKRVLDMGCGSGILGIYASMKGARRVLGIDHDQWAYENALENVDRNGVTSMEVRLGSTDVLGDECFDLILANITRTTLVQDMQVYCKHLAGEGVLMVSGFLAEDVQYVLNEAYRCALEHRDTCEESNWIRLTFVKPLTGC